MVHKKCHCEVVVSFPKQSLLSPHCAEIRDCFTVLATAKNHRRIAPGTLSSRALRFSQGPSGGKSNGERHPPEQ